MKRKRVCDAAVEVLRETKNEAVMWGDSGLLHLIAERAGIAHRAWETEDQIIAALSKTPGLLIPGHTLNGRNRRVRIFRLPESK